MDYSNLNIPLFNENILNQMPFICFYKDQESIFRGINTSGIHSIGFNRAEEIIGFRDSDLQPFQKNADRYRKQDCHTLKGNTQLNIESIVDRNGKRNLHFIQKSPWLNEYNEMRGVMGLGFCLTSDNFKNILMDFSKFNPSLIDFSLQDKNTKKRFIYDSFYFSHREAQVVSLLLKGHKTKTISLKLNLSTRTVEHYIETIRFKTNTEGKDDFICKAFESGFIELMFSNN